jgi:AAA ATPase domain
MVAGQRSEDARRWLIGPTGLLAVAEICARAREWSVLTAAEASDLFDWLDDEGMAGPGPRPSDRARAIVAASRVGAFHTVGEVERVMEIIAAGFDVDVGTVVGLGAADHDELRHDPVTGLLRRWAPVPEASEIADLLNAVHGRHSPLRDRSLAVAFPTSSHDAGEVLLLIGRRCSGASKAVHDVSAAPFASIAPDFAGALDDAWHAVGTPRCTVRWHVAHEYSGRPVETVTGRSAGLAAAVLFSALETESIPVDRDLVFTGVAERAGDIGSLTEHAATGAYRHKLSATTGRRLVVPARDFASVADLAAQLNDAHEVVPIRHVRDLPTTLQFLHHGRPFVARRRAQEDAPERARAALADLPEPLRGQERWELVGRGAELTTLTEIVLTPSSVPRIILLGGEAGAGKSRLVREVARRVAGEVTVDFVRCDEYSPVTQSEILALPERVSKRSLVVLEDAHWATSSALGTVRDLVMIGDGGDTTILMTYRCDERPASTHLDALLDAARRSHPRVSAIDVDVLAVSDVLRLVAAAGPDIAVWRARDLAEDLHRLTGGNALFVTELLGAPRPQVFVDDLERLLEEPADASHALDALVQARLSRMTHPEILGAAAIAGDEVDYDALRAITGLADDDLLSTLAEASDRNILTDVDGERLRYRFTHAVVRSIVQRSISATRRTQYHARAAAYFATTLRTDDPSRNAILAYHYGSVSPDLHVNEAIAYSLAAGDDAAGLRALDEAERWYIMAVEHARHVSDFATLVASQLALGRNRRRRGDGSARQILLGAARRALELRRADMLVACVLAAHRGFFSQTGAVDHEWVELIEAALDLVGDDRPHRAELLAVLAAELTWERNDERRFAIADEALELALGSGDPRVLAHVRYRRSFAIAALDTVDARDEGSRALLELADELGDDEYGFIAAITRATVAAEVGRMDEALVRVADAEHFADLLREAVPAFLCRLARAGAHITEGQLDMAEAVSLDALHLGESAEVSGDAAMLHGEQVWELRRLQGRGDEIAKQAKLLAASDEPAIAIIAARYAHETGEVAAAEKVFERFRADGHSAIGRGLTEPVVVRDLAFLATRFGDRTTAAELYRRLQGSSDHFANSTVVRPCGHHYLAMLSVTLGEDGAAEYHFDRAARAHKQQRAPLLEAETLLEWGRSMEDRSCLGRAGVLAADAGAHGLVEAVERAYAV